MRWMWMTFTLAALIGTTAATAKEGMRTAPFEGHQLRYSTPSGICPVDPNKGGYEALVWRNSAPRQQQRGTAKLVAVDIDCATLAAATEEKPVRPKLVLSIISLDLEKENPTSLDGMLDERYRYFAENKPMTERFWQKPPIAGTALAGRDQYAVYAVYRQLNAAGKTDTAGITAYTMKFGKPLLVNFHWFGDDLPQEARQFLKPTIWSLHDQAQK